MKRSNDFLASITEIQEQTAIAIFKSMLSKGIRGECDVSTPKEHYTIKKQDYKGGTFTIDDGMDIYNEYTINPVELIGILENLEEE